MVQTVWILYLTLIACQAALNRGFKSEPSIVKTFENDTVWLQCNVEDIGVQTRVRWFKDSNTLLVDSDEPSLIPPKRVRMWSDSSLEVSHVQPEDAGKYVCNVSLPDLWGYFTQVHEIVVLYPPTVHSVPESGELEVDLGDEVDMACVSKGVPTPIIFWRTKDGVDAKPRLRFLATDRNLSGLYTCVANNSIGEAVTASVELRIRYKPEIEIRKTWIHASPGIRAQLNCRVTAWPKAKVSHFWKIADDRITLLIDFRSENLVEHLKQQDAATYAETLQNFNKNRGNLKGTSTVFVKECNSANLRTIAQTRLQNSQSFISKVEWIFQNETVQYSPWIVHHTADINHSLIIRNVKNADYGDYVCRARNSLGITDAIVTLSGVANPAVFKEAQPISRTAYNFIWEVDCYIPIIEYQFWFRKYARGARGEWHKLFIPCDSDATGPVHARSFNLTGLAAATHYEAMLFSRNRYGLSRPSRVLRFATEGAPPDASENDKANDLSQEKIIQAVQLASMSQYSPIDTTIVSNGSPRVQQTVSTVAIVSYVLLVVVLTDASSNS